MGGVPIIGDAVETVTDVVSDVGGAITGKKKKRTQQTRPAETATATKPAEKKDVTRTLRRGIRSRRRLGKSLVGGRLFPTPNVAEGKDLNPIRNPRDQSTLG